MGYRSYGNGTLRLNDKFGPNWIEGFNTLKKKLEENSDYFTEQDGKTFIVDYSWHFTLLDPQYSEVETYIEDCKMYCVEREFLDILAEFLEGEYQIKGEENEDIWDLIFRDGKVFARGYEFIPKDEIPYELWM